MATSVGVHPNAPQELPRQPETSPISRILESHLARDLGDHTHRLKQNLRTIPPDSSQTSPPEPSVSTSGPPDAGARLYPRKTKYVRAVAKPTGYLSPTAKPPYCRPKSTNEPF